MVPLNPDPGSFSRLLTFCFNPHHREGVSDWAEGWLTANVATKHIGLFVANFFPPPPSSRQGAQVKIIACACACITALVRALIRRSCDPGCVDRGERTDARSCETPSSQPRTTPKGRDGCLSGILHLAFSQFRRHYQYVWLTWRSATLLV